MASLTPLSKGLIALIVVGGMASAVWHLALKERFATSSNGASKTVPAAAAAAAAPEAPPVPPPAAPSVQVNQGVAAPAPPAAPPQAEAAKAQLPRLSAGEHAEAGRKHLASNSFAQARLHLEQAVQDGDGAAACLLGEMTLKGQGGITASQEKAASLFRLAQARNMICFAGS